MLTKCPCQCCDNAIEFEVSEFVESGRDFKLIYGPKIQCPHCGKDTILFIEKPRIPEATRVEKLKPEPPKKEAPAKISVPENTKDRPFASTTLLSLSSAVLFIIGCGLVFSGCSGEVAEQSNPEGSAIRQTVFAIQYGLGFVTIALSLILGALIRLIQK